MKGCAGAIGLAFVVILFVFTHNGGDGNTSSTASPSPTVEYIAANPSDPANVHGCDAWNEYLTAINAIGNGTESAFEASKQIRSASQLIYSQGPLAANWTTLAIDIGTVATALDAGDAPTEEEAVTTRQAQKIAIIASC